MIVYSVALVELTSHFAIIQLRQIRHENIAAFVGLSIDGSQLCFISEYAEKQTLRFLIDNDGGLIDSELSSELCWELLEVLCLFF